METGKERDAGVLQSVDNALKIIDVLTSYHEMGISEISRMLKIGKSTAYRLISSLKARGFVEQNTSNEKYCLSLKFSYIGSIVLKRLDLTSISHQYLERLTETYNETTHLAVLDGIHSIFIDKVNSPNVSIQMNSAVGSRMPAYCTGTGKLLLAYQSEEYVRKNLSNVNFEKYTYNTILDIDSLIEEFKKIRINGFSEDNEEKEIGLCCYAAPVKNNQGNIIAAVSISGPCARMKEKRVDIINSIKQVGADISKAIGWFEHDIH